MSMNKRTLKRFTEALSEECARQQKFLRVPGYPRPYYISYLLRDVHSIHLWGRLGNINQVTNQTGRSAYCDVRVGSFRFDQVTEGGLDDHDAENETYEHVEMPVGNDTDALKYHLWKLTDSRYREAVRHYFRKKSQHITYRDHNQDIGSFQRSKAQVDLRFKSRQSVDVDYFKNFVEKSSRVLKRYPQVKNSWVEFRVRDVMRVFVNSEGSKLVDQVRVCELSCDLWLLTSEGEGVSTRVVHIAPCIEDLPDLPTFTREIRNKAKLLDKLAAAPTLKSYAGPVLLAPGPAGILFHEVLGHRLEGSRLLSTREGQTFSRDMGKKILPEKISVVDDPTATTCGGKRTVGTYRYDDEGSPGQRVVLINRGKLVNFLSGRAPIRKGRHRGNGHARNEYHERPISRMANLIVDVKEGVSHAELKKRFIAEIKRQEQPFGIMILDADGGETATESYDFQAFMGQVALAVQVWADGRENLIRNVNFVGTPLSALRNIILVGDTAVCENAYCGAESGVIPVSTTCPAVLMANLELQAADQRKYTPYVLPMPYEQAALKKRRCKK
ncbi:MAG: TldD/PmbA family protein [Deltaproteobacteria bacterium]|nr:TldD/PmbA family protein [Deltaproteobacteria bacterium]